MTWIFLLIGAGVIVGTALAVAGRWDSQDAGPDRTAGVDVPVRWTADGLRRVRFRPALRGYRMEDVDAVVSSLAGQMEASDHGARPISRDAAGQAGSEPEPDPERL